ncbi:hypothetical protein BTO28_13640 [Domibacillus epiphyticus]|uniref:GGDEF domain-containing protein n=1 Tax=Domibacillus epiphyticus TaxID=1714355 RepID=A0A1V2A563_9BACI|nr:hypothetical protein BTO28_13640 [Domibacillus epiphyticus]
MGLPGTDIETTQTIAEDIKTETTISLTGKTVTVTIGVGDLPRMITRFYADITDQALYKAKQEGRKRIVTGK